MRPRSSLTYRPNQWNVSRSTCCSFEARHLRHLDRIPDPRQHPWDRPNSVAVLLLFDLVEVDPVHDERMRLSGRVLPPGRVVPPVRHKGSHPAIMLTAGEFL